MVVIMEDNKNLKSTIEAILFASGDAIDINVICTSLEVTSKELMQVAGELRDEYVEQGRGISIVIMDSMVQMCTSEEYSETVESILSPIRCDKLTKSAIEVLSIIAYRQPVTRTEVAEVRGVRSDYLITTLMKKGLIEKRGFKDTLGKPSTYYTTELFLRDFNLESIDQLPQLDNVVEEIDIMELTKDETDENASDGTVDVETADAPVEETVELFDIRKI